MTFGELIFWLVNLDRSIDRLRPVFAGIKDGVGLPFRVILSLLPHLNLLRNLAAHHSRLWDRKLTAYTLATPRRGPSELMEALAATPGGGEQFLYRSLVVLGYLTERYVPACAWPKELCTLLIKHNPMFSRMGFPPDWKSLTLWQRWGCR